MPKKNRIDTLKEQISFIEARITRYQELALGGVYKRILFGGGQQAKLGFAGVLLGFGLMIYGLLELNKSWVFLLIFILAAVVFGYSLVQLNLMRKKNPPEKFAKMVGSLSEEMASMDQELGRLLKLQADEIEKLENPKKR